MHIKRDNSVKVIIPVHYGGEPVDLENLWELQKNMAYLSLKMLLMHLETEYNGIKIGNTDHAAAFSFYANKNITTGGEGGAFLLMILKGSKCKIKKLSFMESQKMDGIDLKS